MTYDFVEGTPEWVKKTIVREAERTGVPTKLLSAQMKQESGFQTEVGSVAGAMGISQFIPSTARAYGLRVDGQVDERKDPDKAIRAQADMMAELIGKYGSIERALSAYNSGQPDNYKNPDIRTWYGSVGETYKYVKNITAESGLSGSVDLEANKVLGKTDESYKMPTDVFNNQQQMNSESAKLVPNIFNKAKEAFIGPVQAQESVMPMAQKLNVGVPRAPALYTVKPGDTPSQIAQRYLGDASRWTEIYKGDPRKMPVGLRINIPSQTSSSSAPSSNYRPPSSGSSGGTYTVSRGETPGGIAQKMLGDWNRWREIWSGNPRKMPTGAQLKIPAPSVA